MQRAGPYELRERLGRGGMGAVFRAVDTRTGQEVALKRLVATDDRARRRLLLEARALARLRHPNVVALLEAGDDADGPWIALELVRGRSLQARLNEMGPLAPRDAARLVLELSAGLAHAHQEGVLHRDLKPDNVLLPDDGPPKLTDFGLAGFTGDASLTHSRLTKTGMLMGTPGYWAPEQATGQTGAIGAATDVYGMGAVLYAALTAEPPIRGESLSEVLIATMQQSPCPTGDVALDAILVRCLAKLPGERPPSIDALRVELERYLSGAAPAGDAVGREVVQAARAAGGPAQGSRLLVTLLAGAIVVAAGVGLLVRRDRTGRPAEPPPNAPSPPPTMPAPSPVAPGPPPAPTTAEPPPSASGLVQRAERLLAEGRWRAALDDLDAALALDPEDALALHRRGVARARLGDHRGAIGDQRAALELAPDARWSDDARLELGRAIDQVASVEQAAAAAERPPLTAAAGEDLEALLASASERGACGDNLGALAELDRAVTLHPTSGRARLERALVKEQLGDRLGASVDLDRALDLDPGDVRALVARASARQRSRDPQGALEDYTRALEVDAQLPAAHVGRAVAKLALGDVGGAEEDFDQAIELEQGDATAFLGRAEARRARGDLPGAAADLDRALELSPLSVTGYLRRSEVRRALGDDRGALADLDRLIELEDGYGTPAVLFQRGELRAALGDARGAEEDFGLVVMLETSSTRALLGRAAARMTLGDHRGAAEDYERALALNSGAEWAAEARARLAEARARLAGR